jgi:protein-tyrosine phosphatase
MHQDLGVGAAREPVAPLAEAVLEGGMVVDLAVEDRPNGPVFVAQGLVAALDVDDAQPARAQGHVGSVIDEEALVIGSAVHERGVHRRHGGSVGIVGVAAYAAHFAIKAWLVPVSPAVGHHQGDAQGSLHAPVIDLHCHLLPGIDDGPATIEDSVAFADALAADGTRIVAATPHLRSDHPGVVVSELRERCNRLQDELAVRGVPLQIVAGAEVDLLWAHQASRDELALACYGDGGTDLLLETPYGPLPARFAELVQDLIDDGFRILLAHPERNPAFQQDPSALRDLVERGVLVQVTAASLALDPARSSSAKTARQLIAEDSAHVISSDLHGSPTVRRAPLSAGVEAAAEVAPERARLMVTDAPAAILAGQPLPDLPPAPRQGLLARLRRA